jgi:hypothetical protein
MAEKVKRYSRAWWVEELKQSEKRLKDKWWDAADKVIDRYLDNRESGDSDAYRYNVFWANVGILKASLYANAPKPMVSRQYSDHMDDVARVAGEMMERMLTLDLQKEISEEHQAYRHAVEDRLIPGAGQVWYRYEPTIEKKSTEAVVDPMTGAELAPAQEYEEITDEQVECDHINFKDFLFPVARTWEEVPWVARRAHMTKVRVEARFGKEIADELFTKGELFEDGSPESMRARDSFKRGRGEIFEIWCKDTRKVYWIAFTGPDKLLDEKEDPLRLPGLFPCPRPLFATLTTNDLIPRPDYVMIQDQYRELDELSERCVLLEKSLRVAGVYDQSNDAIKQLVNGKMENVLIPVEQWAALAEKGGLKGVVDWMPIDIVSKVLGELSERRMDKIQQIYELTGLSDIMRGATKERETATAQTLKAQYSSVRLQYLQQEVGIFVQHGLRIKAEIIAEHFQPQTILARTNIQNTEDAPLAQQAVELLKNKKLAMYRIEVNADSMAIPDYNAERSARAEFMQMFGAAITAMQPIMMAMPTAAPFLLKLLQWAAAPLRGSRQAEAILDQAIKSLEMNPPPPAQEGGGANENDVAAAKEGTATEQAKGQSAVAAERAKLATKQGSEQASQQTAMVKAVAGLIQPPPPPQEPGVAKK